MFAYRDVDTMSIRDIDMMSMALKKLDYPSSLFVMPYFAVVAVALL